MKEMPTTHEVVVEAILDFPWWNFGLDEVGDADPEYAGALATEIMKAFAKHQSELYTV